jgi:2,3-bisphosphoglycerate-independent phosphoglycerate mutase
MSSLVALIILDGFGYSTDTECNAIYHADTPILDSLLARYPHSLLEASGSAVGLLPGQIGNSQAGHLTIGAGKIIQQDITRVIHAIEDATLFNNRTLTTALMNAKSGNRQVHIIGLLSDAGVHGHEKIIHALLQSTHEHRSPHVYLHVILDGRDVAPKSAAHYLETLDHWCTQYGGTIATIQGRFYAMDRDRNWQRTQQAYDILTDPIKSSYNTWREALESYYKQGITDEFIIPTRLTAQGIIQPDDLIIFANCRPERMRQLTASFATPEFNHFPVRSYTPQLITLVTYDTYPTVSVLFPLITVDNTLKEIIHRSGKSIFTIAETEKYAHVTYFFDGRKDLNLAHETRVRIPSKRLHDYSSYPAMSAPEITAAVVQSLHADPKDFYLINYANADMVGHSGNFQSTIKAIECLDVQIGALYREIVTTRGGALIITSDHGKAEDMCYETVSLPKTRHTTNPVYYLMINCKHDVRKTAKALTLAAIQRHIVSELQIEHPSAI